MLIRHKEGNLFYFEKTFRNYVSYNNPHHGLQTYGGRYNFERHSSERKIKAIASTNLCFWED